MLRPPAIAHPHPLSAYVAQAAAPVCLQYRFIHSCDRSKNYDAYEVVVATIYARRFRPRLHTESTALTDIEQEFFGEIDTVGSKAVKKFANFSHNSGAGAYFQNFIAFLSAQKLRTPKGLAWLRSQTKGYSRNQILETMTDFHRMFCAIWAECVWQIADARDSATKFIFSDHPVTVYNRSYGPNCDTCKGFSDPDIKQHGSHTLFPLSPEKILICQ